MKLLYIICSLLLSSIAFAQTTSKTFGKWTGYVDKDPYENKTYLHMRTPIYEPLIKADLKLVFNFDSIGNVSKCSVVLVDPLPSKYIYFTQEKRAEIGSQSNIYINVAGVMEKKYLIFDKYGWSDYWGEQAVELVNLFSKGTDGALKYYTITDYYKYSLVGFSAAYNYYKEQFKIVYKK